MLLAIDIGNTDTVIGLFDDKTIKVDFRIASSHNLTPDETGLFITGLLEKYKIDPTMVKRVIISSVVPQLTPVYEATSVKYLNVKPMIVNTNIKLPIKIDIDSPDEVGADRIVNSVAGFTIYGGPVIIVDFGTATTFDVINESGSYIGGVIIPGPVTSMAELARRAVKLFEVKMEQPERVVGRSTAQALKSGMFYGNIGQVDFILRKIIEETGFEKPSIIATGGLAQVVSEASELISKADPTLTLEGLRLIADFQAR